jgi:hypothetical protein
MGDAKIHKMDFRAKGISLFRYQMPETGYRIVWA